LYIKQDGCCIINNTLKHLLLILSLIFVYTPVAQATDSHVQGLALSDIFSLVQTQNAGIQAGEYGVQAKVEYKRQARSALFPQFGAQVYQGRTREMNDYGKTGMFPSTYNSFTSSLTASITVFNATNIAAYKAAKLEVEAARYQHDADIQDAMANAASLYFLYQRNLSALHVVENNITLDENLLNVAIQKRNADMATDLDVTRAQSKLSQDQQTLLVKQTELSKTRRQLLQSIGMDLTSEINPRTVDIEAPRLDVLPDWNNVVHNRPEYMAIEELIERYRVDERAADWKRFPTVSIQGQFGHASRLPGDGDGGAAGAVGLTMNMTIWDSGQITAQKQQALALVRQQEYLLKQISDSIHSDYDQAREAVKERLAELPLARETVRLGELELKYAQERFQAGANDNSAVVQAQASLSNARDTLVDATYRYYLARIDLARVLGQVQMLK
jgi:outer membrane protein